MMGHTSLMLLGIYPELVVGTPSVVTEEIGKGRMVEARVRLKFGGRKDYRMEPSKKQSTIVDWEPMWPGDISMALSKLLFSLGDLYRPVPKTLKKIDVVLRSIHTSDIKEYYREAHSRLMGRGITLTLFTENEYLATTA